MGYRGAKVSSAGGEHEESTGMPGENVEVSAAALCGVCCCYCPIVIASISRRCRLWTSCRAPREEVKHDDQVPYTPGVLKEQKAP